MKRYSPDDMLEATRLTRAGRLTEAAGALQRMLAGRNAATIDGVTHRPLTPQPHRPGPSSATIDGMVERIGAAAATPAHRLTPSNPALRPDRDARFLARTFTSQAGTRPYKLYISDRPGNEPRPLIVMLHGCTQTPDDFATGTKMNVAAETHGCLVVYPGQTGQANPQRCWNWFNPNDQRRDAGEPSLIAGITRQVMRDFTVDPGRVYIAGLSAGGAAAAIMADAYPDLYAAIAVHSGLACGAARDMRSAFTVMRHGADPIARSPDRRIVPAIVFHGGRDSTVSARNGDAVVAQALNFTPARTRVEFGQVPGGHAYSRTLYFDASGRTMVEQWVVPDAGHAWFGGSPAGSYTDPFGPDATAEMMRFFLQHPR